MNFIEKIILGVADLLMAFRDEYLETAELNEAQKDAVLIFYDYLISRLKGML